MQERKNSEAGNEKEVDYEYIGKCNRKQTGEKSKK